MSQFKPIRLRAFQKFPKIRDECCRNLLSIFYHRPLVIVWPDELQ